MMGAHADSLVSLRTGLAVVTGPGRKSEGCFGLGTSVEVEVDARSAFVDAAADVMECEYVGVREDVEEVNPHSLHVPRSSLLERCPAVFSQPNDSAPSIGGAVAPDEQPARLHAPDLV